LVPGTNTSFRVGGYAKFDLQTDFSAHQGFVGNGAGTAPVIAVQSLDNNVPGSVIGANHGIHGNTELSAGESRFNVETRTPTSYGEFKTYIEGDFEGVSAVSPNSTAGNTFENNSNRSAFALRHAYGTFGPLLAGQFFSLFEDLAAAPETLDFGGALGVSGPLRQAQLRYVYSAGNGLTIAGSIENPQTLVFNSCGSTTCSASGINVPGGFGSSSGGNGQGEKLPDLVGAVIWSQGPAHIAFRGVVRDLYDHNPVAVTGAGNSVGTPPTNASTVGWGLGVSGDYHVFGKDDIIFQANGGNGIGRYITNTGNFPGEAIVSKDGQTLEAITGWGGVIAYQHWWADTLRSTIEGSILTAQIPTDLFTAAQAAPNQALGGINHRMLSSHLNLIWSPVPAVDLGVEYIWEQRKTQAGQIGTLNRSQSSTKFKF